MPSRKSTVLAPRRAGKLTPGQRLPREIVAASQRERMIIATVELVRNQGYPATNVAQVTRRASVSRAAFYEHFTNKEECFMATYEELMTRGGAHVVAAYRAPGLDWRGRLRAALNAYLHYARAWPEGMHICIVDALSAGPRTDALRAEMMDAARRMADHCLSEAPDNAPLSPNLTRALLGGIFRVTYTLVREQRAQELPGLLDDLEAWVLACRHPPMRGRSGREGERVSAIRATTGGRDARTPPRVSRGGGGEAPAQEQRARIIDAVVELCSSEGYAEMTHQQIATLAGVSFTTFYKHFENKQDALLGAFDASAEQTRGAIVAAAADAPDWSTALRDGLGAALRTMADAPAIARVREIEIAKLGPAGFRRIDAARAAEYLPLLAPAYEHDPGLSRVLIDATLGAIAEVVYDYTSLDREDELPALVGELTYIALAPFVGSEKAARIADARA